MMRNRYESDEEGYSTNFQYGASNSYPLSSEKNSQDIFFTASITKKNVGEVRNRQRFQEILRQLEETCETNRSSWNMKDLVEQPF